MTGLLPADPVQSDIETSAVAATTPISSFSTAIYNIFVNLQVKPLLRLSQTTHLMCCKMKICLVLKHLICQVMKTLMF